MSDKENVEDEDKLLIPKQNYVVLGAVWLTHVWQNHSLQKINVSHRVLFDFGCNYVLLHLVQIINTPQVTIL